jgi:hypothetical protein
VSPQLQLALYVLLLGSLMAGALVRPALALTGVACVFGLKQWGQASIPWLAQNPTFTNVAIGCTVLAALGVQTMRGECVPCRMRAMNWLVFALYGYALLSLLWTPRPDLAIGSVWLHNYPYVLTFVVLTPLVVKDLDGLRGALLALAMAGGALLVALLVFGDWGVRGLILPGNLHEQETNPLALAGLAGTVASCALFVRSGRLSRFGWPLRIAIVIVSLFVIVRSGSRGQLIAVLGALLLMLPVAFRITKLRGVAGILIALTIIGLALTYAYTEYMQSNAVRWSESLATRDAAGRWAMALKLLHVWSESGVGILIGLGNSASFDPAILRFYPHNVPLEILGEEGLVGAALYLSILWLAVSRLRRAWRSARGEPEPLGVLAAIGASFVFMFLISLKEGNMVGSVYFFMYAILLGRLPELILRGRHASESRVREPAHGRLEELRQLLDPAPGAHSLADPGAGRSGVPR